MTDAEYREFLTYLFERYIRPRLAWVRRHYAHHMEDEFSYHFDRAVPSAWVLRFIERYCRDDGEVYRTFTAERLAEAVYTTRDSVAFSNRIADEGGYLDAFEAHAREIADGLMTIQLPDADKEAFREMGSLNPDIELRSLMYLAKSWIESYDRKLQDIGFRQQLRQIEDRLKKAADEFATLEKTKEQTLAEVPKRSRRWFKGLGQIGQGSALSIADMALAIGALHLPVSPETQSWGAIASVTTGIATVLSGVGDLRNE
jgi:hypothetical protein